MKNYNKEKALRIMNLVDTHKESLIKDTAKLLSFRTISSLKGEPDPETQEEFHKAFTFIKEISARMGFSFRMLDNKVGIVELQASSPEAETIGVLLHIDVMPPGESEWKYPPFSGTVAEDKIWGRGAQDDKGPIIATLYGLWAAKEIASAESIHRNCRLIIGTQEETGDWSDIHFYKQQEGVPDFSIVPDAEFPIINAEKGMVNMELCGEWDESPLSEKAGVAFVSLVSGERANMVPDKAVLILQPKHPDARNALEQTIAELRKFYPEAKIKISEEGANFKVEFSGMTAHGSRPFEGHNAAVDALRFVDFLKMNPPSFARYIEFIKEAGESIWGDRLGIKSEHSFVGKTTSSLGLLRIDNNNGKATFNIRNTLGLSVDTAEERIQSVLKNLKKETGVKITLVRKSSGTEPLFVDPEEFRHYIEPLKFAYETVTERKAELKAIGGTTFAKSFPRAVSFGPVLLEEEKEMAHQTDEHVAVTHQLRNAKIYAIALWALISGV